MTALALGIDVGTTRVKAQVVALDGTPVGPATAALTPWQLTDAGPQIDVARLADLAIEVADEAARRAADDGGRVAAIGVTGMAETGALLGADGAPLAPGFAWHHTLGHPDAVQHALGAEAFARTTGRDCSISPSIIKLDLLRREGHRFARGQLWLNIPEYVAYRLTGVPHAEVSEASRTGLLDIAGRRWWDAALEFLGAGTWLLPGDVLPGGTRLGPVLSSLPASLRGAIVGVGGHDHPTAALAVGAREPGTLALSLGTAEAQLRFTAASALDAADFPALVATGSSIDIHPLGEMYTVLSARPTGMTLARLATALGCETVAERLALSQAALAAGDAAPGVHLSDVTYDDFSITGLTDGVTRPGLWRRAVEDLIDASTSRMSQVSGLLGPSASAVMFGGWVHDPLVAHARRGQLGGRLTTADVEEPGAVGAGLLAALAAELIDELPAAATQPTSTGAAAER